MDEPVVLRYTWNAEELLAATRWHYRHLCRPAVRYGIYFIAVLMLVLGSVALVVLPYSSVPPDWIISAAVIVAFLYSFGWLFFRRMVLRWIVRRQFVRRPDQQREIEYQFTREKLRFKTRVSEGSASWEAYFKAVRTPDGLLLYLLDRLFVWLPRHSFANDDDFEKVVQMAKLGVVKFYEAR